MDNPEAAREAFEQAARVFSATIGEESPSAANAKVGLGESLVRLDRSREAIPILETAITILTEDGERPVSLATGRFALARALRAVDTAPTTHEVARGLANEAKAAMMEADEPELASEVDAWPSENEG